MANPQGSPAWVQQRPYPDGPPFVLLAEDNVPDQRLLVEAFDSCPYEACVQVVSNGADLLDYLYGPEAPGESRTRPNLIFLDLNMPLVDGKSALRKIKTDPALRKIPVVVFTASRDNGDVSEAYDLGANVYMEKPDSFIGWVSAVETIHEFFFRSAVHPDGASS